MFEEIINKKTKTITVKTDYPFVDYKIEKHRDYFYHSFKKNNNESMGACLFFNQFNGRKYYPNEININSVDVENGIVELEYT